MSAPENFIARWSRRKREAAQDPAQQDLAQQDSAQLDLGQQGPAQQELAQDLEQKAMSAAPAEGAEQTRAAPVSAHAPTTPAFDVNTLPPLESITAETDIRAFLVPGVPAEITRAALRRAWASDPNIRDFIGLSENSWDFNDPGAIPGFGSLEMTDELRRQIARMVGGSLTDAAEEPRQQGEPEVSAELVVDVGSPTDAATSTALSQDEPVKSDSARYSSSAALQCEANHTATQNIPPYPDHSQAPSDNDQLIAKRPHGRALPK
jgi:hypothetical protein